MAKLETDIEDPRVGAEKSLQDAESPNDDLLELAAPANPIPASTPNRRQSQHLGTSREYWRDIILGVNDGLVSTFLLVAGVAGGGLSSNDILLTAIAGAIAGAVSMCAGEYVATKSQNEVLQGELVLEKRHIDQNLHEEMNEVTDLLKLIGVDDTDLQSNLCEYYQQRPEALLKLMTALEFGVLQNSERSPVCAGLTSCGLFLIGAMPSVLPFIFSGEHPLYGLIAAAVLTSVTLLLVGAIKTWATRGSCLRASAENLLIAALGGGLAYGVGVGFDSVLHTSSAAGGGG